MRIEWARSARDDLKDLRDYIAKDSPYYAQRFIERIIAAVVTSGPAAARTARARGRS